MTTLPHKLLLACDPGLAKLGLSLFDLETGKVLMWEFVETPSTDALDDRLRAIQIAADGLIKGRPVKLWYETIPPMLSFPEGGGGPTVGKQLSVAEALGVVKAEVLRSGGACHGTNSRAVKVGVTQDSKASKAKIRNAVISEYPHLAAIKTQKADLFDAIAIGMYGVSKEMKSPKKAVEKKTAKLPESQTISEDELFNVATRGREEQK